MKFIPNLTPHHIATPHTDVFGYWDNHEGNWSGVEIEGKIVSFCLLTASNPYPIISSIGTIKNKRRIGAATFLLSEVHKHFAKETFVAWSNTQAGEGLLRKCGYDKIKRGPKFIRIPGKS
jgi:hypothetical protein